MPGRVAYGSGMNAREVPEYALCSPETAKAENHLLTIIRKRRHHRGSKYRMKRIELHAFTAPRQSLLRGWNFAGPAKHNDFLSDTGSTPSGIATQI
jgi:hypothetical protein